MLEAFAKNDDESDEDPNFGKKKNKKGGAKGKQDQANRGGKKN